MRRRHLHLDAVRVRHVDERLERGLVEVLLAIFLLWLLAANAIYAVTLGPEPPVSIAATVRSMQSRNAEV